MLGGVTARRIQWRTSPAQDLIPKTWARLSDYAPCQSRTETGGTRAGPKDASDRQCLLKWQVWEIPPPDVIIGISKYRQQIIFENHPSDGTWRRYMICWLFSGYSAIQLFIYWNWIAGTKHRPYDRWTMTRDRSMASRRDSSSISLILCYFMALYYMNVSLEGCFMYIKVLYRI